MPVADSDTSSSSRSVTPPPSRATDPTVTLPSVVHLGPTPGSLQERALLRLQARIAREMRGGKKMRKRKGKGRTPSVRGSREEGDPDTDNEDDNASAANHAPTPPAAGRPSLLAAGVTGRGLGPGGRTTAHYGSPTLDPYKHSGHATSVGQQQQQQQQQQQSYSTSGVVGDRRGGRPKGRLRPHTAAASPGLSPAPPPTPNTANTDASSPTTAGTPRSRALLHHSLAGDAVDIVARSHASHRQTRSAGGGKRAGKLGSRRPNTAGGSIPHTARGNDVGDENGNAFSPHRTHSPEQEQAGSSANSGRGGAATDPLNGPRTIVADTTWGPARQLFTRYFPRGEGEPCLSPAGGGARPGGRLAIPPRTPPPKGAGKIDKDRAGVRKRVSRKGRKAGGKHAKGGIGKKGVVGSAMGGGSPTAAGMPRDHHHHHGGADGSGYLDYYYDDDDADDDGPRRGESVDIAHGVPLYVANHSLVSYDRGSASGSDSSYLDRSPSPSSSSSSSSSHESSANAGGITDWRMEDDLENAERRRRHQRRKDGALGASPNAKGLSRNTASPSRVSTPISKTTPKSMSHSYAGDGYLEDPEAVRERTMILTRGHVVSSEVSAWLVAPRVEGIPDVAGFAFTGPDQQGMDHHAGYEEPPTARSAFMGPRARSAVSSPRTPRSVLQAPPQRTFIPPPKRETLDWRAIYRGLSGHDSSRSKNYKPYATRAPLTPRQAAEQKERLLRETAVVEKVPVPRFECLHTERKRYAPRPPRGSQTSSTRPSTANAANPYHIAMNNGANPNANGDQPNNAYREGLVDFASSDWSSLSPEAWSDYSRVKSAALFEEMRRRSRMRMEREHRKIWDTGKASGSAAELRNRKRLKNVAMFQGKAKLK